MDAENVEQAFRAWVMEKARFVELRAFSITT